MRPLMYGYMRVHDAEEDNTILQLEAELRNFAVRNGFCFGTIFHEHVPGSYAAFDELIEELQRADAHHVIVPSTRHLAENRILRESLLSRLDSHAQARVLELGDQ